METKKFLKKSFSALTMSVFGLAVSVSTALAAGADWITQYDSRTGGINVTVGSRGTLNSSGGSWALTNPYGLPSGSLLGIASNLLFWLLSLFAIAGIVGFVLSGIFYLLAGADEGNAKKGKSGMTASIIGIIVGLSGFVIMQAVASLLGGGSKTF